METEKLAYIGKVVALQVSPVNRQQRTVKFKINYSGVSLASTLPLTQPEQIDAQSSKVGD
jgi:hypothetical protein